MTSIENNNNAAPCNEDKMLNDGHPIKNQSKNSESTYQKQNKHNANDQVTTVVSDSKDCVDSTTESSKRSTNTTTLTSNNNDSKDNTDNTVTETSISISQNESHHHSEFIGRSGPEVITLALQKYTHIITNEFKGGANGKLPEKMETTCDCKYDPDDPNSPCGDNCINRAIYMECTEDDCLVGDRCKNKRFQKCQYAPMEIFLTEKKGFGLRATSKIKKGEFVIEYCGEVLSHHLFLKRIKEYAQTGVTHFYFMSLKNGEYLDAKKKGNWSRFMNHSCYPNTELQKWIVDGGWRNGMFALRDIQAGEELTFDYKFERYGAAAQPCYCGETVCKGYIGTEKKSEIADLEIVMGDIDSEEDEDVVGDHDTNISARKKRRKSGTSFAADDDDYQEKEKQLSSIEEVKKLVKRLMFTSMKPNKVKKYLRKLEITESSSLLKRFLQLHGLTILKSFIITYMNKDIMICSQVVMLLNKLPIQSRNGIDLTGIEIHLKKLIDQPEMHTATLAKSLIDSWANLPTVYKIPKRRTTDPLSNDLISSGKNIPIKKEASKISTTESPKDITPLRNQYFQDGQEQNVKLESSLLQQLDSVEMTARSYSRDKSNETMSSTRQDSRKYSYTSSSGGMDKVDEFNHLYSQTSTFEIAPVSSSSSQVSEPALPANWYKATSVDGKIYYYNPAEGISQWESPVAVQTKQNHSTEVHRDETNSNHKTSLSSSSPNKRKSDIKNSNDGGDELPQSKKIKQDNEKVNIVKPEEMDYYNFDSEEDGDELGEEDMKKMESKSSFYKDMKGLVSQVVVKAMSKYKDKMDSTKFKKIARKYTHQLLVKEDKSSKGKIVAELSEDKKMKMKKYLHYKLKALGLK